MTRWTSSSRVAVVAVALAAATVGSRASAEPPAFGPDPVASALFRQGRELIKDGRWEEGCAKMALSMERFPAASTMLNLARCEEHEGRIATAWALYQRALVLNQETPGDQRRRELETIANDGIEALEPRLPRLEVRVTAPGGAPLEEAGLRIEEAGRALPHGVAVPLDPGTHDLSITAEGYRRERRRAELRLGERTVVAVELLLDSSASSLTTAPSPERPERHDDPHREDAAPSAVDDGPPAWAWVSGGLGIACGVASAAFAIDAVSVASELSDRCGDDLVCDEDPSFDPSDDNGRKNRSTALAVGFGAAGAVALTAAVLGIALGSSPGAVSGPHTTRVALLAAPTPGGGWVAARWPF
jgi:hypothetical protein